MPLTLAVIVAASSVSSGGQGPVISLNPSSLSFGPRTSLAQTHARTHACIGTHARTQVLIATFLSVFHLSLLSSCSAMACIAYRLYLTTEIHSG